MALLNFNANEVEVSSFEPLPKGTYEAMITNSEMKANKAGNGAYLELTFTVTSGQYKGRLVWSRINLHNQNATAVKIAREELASICRAVGVLAPRDSSELHNRPMNIKVVTTEYDGRESNDIRSYSAIKNAATSNVNPAVVQDTGGAPW